MGDWYEFEIQVIDGKEVPVFCYSNKNSRYTEVIVQLSEHQITLAREWQKKMNALREDKDNLIKGFLGI